MSNANTINISINAGAKVVQAFPGETLFAALTRNRIFVPTICGGKGVCGQCRVKLISGNDGKLTESEIKKLPSEAVTDGFRLACQVIVNAPVSIELPDSAFNTSDYKVKITKKSMLTEDIVMLRCQAIEPKFIHVEPGAWMYFHAPATDYAPQGVARPFSIASDTKDKRNVEFIIRRNPKGICTKWIFEDMKEGDTVTLSGPNGDFRLQDTDKEAIFIAGGSGLSAIRSLLFQLKNQKVQKKVTLFFGAVSMKGLYLVDELRALESIIPDFTFIPALSKPEPEDIWNGEVGLITDVVAKYCGDCTDKEAYLCGSPGMIDACLNVLTANKMPLNNIFFDKFVV